MLKQYVGVSKIAQRVKVLANKLKALGSNPRTHGVEKEKGFSKVVL